MDSKWVLCPRCGSKTRVKLLPETVLRNFPLFCPKCKGESLIHAQAQQVQVARTETEREIRI